MLFQIFVLSSLVIKLCKSLLLQINALCKIVPRQIKAENAVALIRKSVEELIAKCKEIVEAEGERIDEEEYVNDSDPSVLRFLLASREEVCMYYSMCFYFTV